MDKKALRKHMMELRQSFSNETRSQYDSIIYNKLINCEYYNNAKVIFVYVSFMDEADTHKIINHALQNNKTVCVPKIINRTEGMKAVKIDSLSELKENGFGILEPETTTAAVDPKDIELILVPGLAFDKNGGRLGYGAGYYDRFFCEVRAEVKKIAVAYSFQVVDEVPMEEHDVLIDHIVTD
jgi:5-formyltetrahydrofolate cyclo-ligase